MAFRSLVFSYQISHNTIAGIIYDTCDAILECLVEEHKPFPTAELLEKSAKDYEQNYGTSQTVLLVSMASTCTSNALNCLARGTSITNASSP